MIKSNRIFVLFTAFSFLSTGLTSNLAVAQDLIPTTIPSFVARNLPGSIVVESGQSEGLVGKKIHALLVSGKPSGMIGRNSESPAFFSTHVLSTGVSTTLEADVAVDGKPTVKATFPAFTVKLNRFGKPFNYLLLVIEGKSTSGTFVLQNDDETCPKYPDGIEVNCTASGDKGLSIFAISHSSDADTRLPSRFRKVMTEKREARLPFELTYSSNSEKNDFWK